MLDYRNKVVLAPMVRNGELPTRLLSLVYGADYVWGPECIDVKMISCQRVFDSHTGTILFLHPPRYNFVYRIHESEKGRHVFQLGTRRPDLAVQAAKVVANDVAGVDLNCGCPTPDAQVRINGENKNKNKNKI